MRYEKILDKILLEIAFKNNGKIVFNEASFRIMKKYLSKYLNENDIISIIESIVTEDDIVKNKKSGNVYTVKKVNSDTQKLIKKNASKEDMEKLKNKKQDSVENKKSELTKKNLKNIDTIKTEEFTSDLELTDVDFNKKFKSSLTKTYTKIPYNKNIPKKMNQLIERMINLKYNNDTKKISNIAGADAGAGEIRSQLGELLTLTATTMNNEQFDEFKTILLKKLETSEPDTILNKSWVQAMQNNRKAIYNHIHENYENVSNIIGAWDTEAQVESLGLENYKQNKGYSTDVYFKVIYSSGKSNLLEVSLKKDKNIMLFNSSAGILNKYMKKLPKELDATEYSINLSKRLESTGKKYKKELDNIIKNDKEIISLIKQKNIKNIDSIFSANNRSTRKVLFSALSKLKSPEINKFLKEHDDFTKTFISNVMRSVTENEEIKSGLLNDISESLPLRSVSKNEEVIAIGDMMFDNKTFMKIFGTDNFDDIKQKLIINENDIPPTLSYSAGENKFIPIADVSIRPDGVGYGGTVKFEMKLNSKFAKLLSAANKEVYAK